MRRLLFLSKMYVFSQATDPSSQHNSKKTIGGSIIISDHVDGDTLTRPLLCCHFCVFPFLCLSNSGESLKIMVRLEVLIRTLCTYCCAFMKTAFLLRPLVLNLLSCCTHVSAIMAYQESGFPLLYGVLRVQQKKRWNSAFPACDGSAVAFTPWPGTTELFCRFNCLLRHVSYHISTVKLNVMNDHWTIKAKI